MSFVTGCKLGPANYCYLVGVLGESIDLVLSSTHPSDSDVAPPSPLVGLQQVIAMAAHTPRLYVASNLCFNTCQTCHFML